MKNGFPGSGRTTPYSGKSTNPFSGSLSEIRAASPSSFPGSEHPVSGSFKGGISIDQWDLVRKSKEELEKIKSELENKVAQLENDLELEKQRHKIEISK